MTPDKSDVVLRNSSGKPSRWLIDMRRVFLRGDELVLASSIFWDTMEPHLPFQVGGLELGAVPFIAAILTEGNRRGHSITGFIGRKSRKKSGACRQIEGEVTDQPIVLVDDLINSGDSIRNLIITLDEMGHKARDIFVFIHFRKPSTLRWLQREGIEVHSIFDLADLGLTAGEPPKYLPEENTLEIAWKFSPPDPNYVFICPRSTPALDEKYAYYGADNGFFYAVDLLTGEQVWEFRCGGSTKGIFSSPALVAKRVIFGSYDGSVYCLDTSSGALVWRYDAADWVGSSPAVAEELGLVFIGLEHALPGQSGSIAALEIETGLCRWEFIVHEYLHGTPAYCSELGLVAIGTDDSLVLLFDAESGEPKWRFQTQGPVKAGITFDLKRNQIVFGSHDWGCYGVDIDSGQRNFRFEAENVFVSTPLIVEDVLYIGSTDKKLYIYDLETNQPVTTIPTLGRIFSHPAMIDGMIWFGGNDGCIRKIDPKTNRMIGGVHLTERILTQVRFSPKTRLYYAATAGNHLLALRELPNKQA